MSKVKSEITINHSLEDVFSHLSKKEGFGNWVTGVSEVKILTKGPIGIGTKFHRKLTFLHDEIEDFLEIVCFKKNECIEMQTYLNDDHPFFYGIYLEAIDSMQTLVRAELEGKPSPKLIGLAVPIITDFTRKVLQKGLQNLKEQIEEIED